MHLKNTVILAAKTARSNAYAQALAVRGITLKGAVLFAGSHEGKKSGQSSYVPERNWLDAPVFLPDLSIPIDESLGKICKNITHVMAGDVNDLAVIKVLEALSPDLVIYSGYGSQIVGEDILTRFSPILHLHAGWLPDFRGSTTIYYHLLVTGNCAVSAFLLTNKIDTGPILARKSYPKPPAGLDIDYLYDSAIRADLLVEVLEHYMTQGVLPEVMQQTMADGKTYYVIHPVLKHIAIMSLDPLSH